MVVVRITGGLGNQFFQYATAWSLAKKKKCKLYVDSSSYTKDFLRVCELNEYNLDMNILPSFIVSVMRFINVVGYNFFIRNKIQIPNYIGIENNINDEQDISNCFYLEGYWQNTCYFAEDIKRNLLFTCNKQFTEEQFSIANEMDKKESVMLHVRRTDYVIGNNIEEYVNIYDDGYYQRAIRRMKELKGESCFFVFSDDIEWCKTNIILEPDDEVIYVEKGTSVSDFELMRKCKNFIIANSTYSWWAAFLSTSQEKTIIGPKQWFVDNDKNEKVHKALFNNIEEL